MKTVIRRKTHVKETSKKLVVNKALGLGKYKLPMIDEVPAGEYYSVIKRVENSKTSAGKNSITVYYSIATIGDVYKKVHKLLPKGKSINIKYIYQKYPTDSVFYDRFVDAMYSYYDLGEKSELDIEDIIGTPEIISISYTNVNAIGGISERFYCHPDFFDDQDDEEEAIQEVIESGGDELREDEEDYLDLNFNFDD